MTSTQACETPMSDHVERFWQTLSSEHVRILIDIRRDHDEGQPPHWDSASFSNDVAKALVADRLMPTVAQPIPGRGNPEWFCHWLKGYLGAITGRDELDAFEANSIRNTLNEVIGAQPPAAPVETRDAVDVLGDPRDHCDAPRPQCSADSAAPHPANCFCDRCQGRPLSRRHKSEPVAAPQEALSPVKNFIREVSGIWGAFEHDLRGVIGNTNYTVVREKLERAEEACSMTEVASDGA